MSSRNRRRNIIKGISMGLTAFAAYVSGLVMVHMFYSNIELFFMFFIAALLFALYLGSVLYVAKKPGK
jgi:hypothetical protein